MSRVRRRLSFLQSAGPANTIRYRASRLRSAGRASSGSQCAKPEPRGRGSGHALTGARASPKLERLEQDEARAVRRQQLVIVGEAGRDCARCETMDLCGESVNVRFRSPTPSLGVHSLDHNGLDPPSHRIAELHGSQGRNVASRASAQPGTEALLGDKASENSAGLAPLAGRTVGGHGGCEDPARRAASPTLRGRLPRTPRRNRCTSRTRRRSGWLRRAFDRPRICQPMPEQVSPMYSASRNSTSPAGDSAMRLHYWAHPDRGVPPRRLESGQHLHVTGPRHRRFRRPAITRPLRYTGRGLGPASQSQARPLERGAAGGIPRAGGDHAPNLGHRRDSSCRIQVHQTDRRAGRDRPPPAPRRPASFTWPSPAFS